jgi:hypothetical protein
MVRLQEMDSELSMSPVTPIDNWEEVKENSRRILVKPVIKWPPIIELNRNDITNSSVETEKATYEVRQKA